METSINHIRSECLMLAQTFETFWAYYHQSGGRLFDSECRRAAGMFLSSLGDLTSADPEVRNAFDTEDQGAILELLNELRTWAFSRAPFPFQNADFSRFALFLYLTEFKRYLIEKIGYTRIPPMSITNEEFEHSADFVRWKGHLPRAALRGDPEALIREASNADSIVVVGDIRRSQDLMTYSASPQDYSRRIVSFITQTRQLIEKYGGFFDKFTGDGFVAYFNEAICRTAGLDYITAFLSFAREERSFCHKHFCEWAGALRKLPEENIGLAIGADHGRVEFNDLNHHLVAVGEAIVWACRMEAVAKAGEVVVNNLLFRALEKHGALTFERRSGKPKTGEEFRGRVVTIDEIDATTCELPTDPPLRRLQPVRPCVRPLDRPSTERPVARRRSFGRG